MSNYHASEHHLAARALLTSITLTLKRQLDPSARSRRWRPYLC